MFSHLTPHQMWFTPNNDKKLHNINTETLHKRKTNTYTQTTPDLLLYSQSRRAMLQNYSNDRRIEDDYPKKRHPTILILLLHAFHLQDILQKKVIFSNCFVSLGFISQTGEQSDQRHQSIYASPRKMPVNAFPAAFLIYICQLCGFTEFSSVRQRGRRIRLPI